MIKFLSTKQFAEITCTSVQTIYNKINKGELIENVHYYKNGKLRFPDTLIEPFVRGDTPLPPVLDPDALNSDFIKKNKKIIENNHKKNTDEIIYVNSDAFNVHV